MKSTMQSFKENDIIYNEGQTYNEMYKIVSGKVVLYTNYKEKDEHVIGVLSAGKCFGEMNIFTDSTCPYTVVAYADVLIMRITKDGLEEFIVNNPRNAIDIMTSMAYSNVIMKKNINMLLDDLYEKHSINEKRNSELKAMVKKYNAMGIQGYINSR